MSDVTRPPQPRLDLDQIFADVNQMPQVQSRVVQRATQIAARARRIDAAENGGRASITLAERVIDNGRFVVQVRSDDVDGEHGTSRTTRRRTLRRAVGGR